MRARRSQAVILAAIILVAAGVRLYRLGNPSLWYDEAVTVLLSRDISALPKSLGTSAPLSFVIAHFWNRLGESEFWIRLWAAFFGIAIVPVVWGLARIVLDRQTAAVAAFLVAINPLCIYYSQEARAYSLLPFWVLLGALLALLAVKSQRWAGFAVASAVALALAFYSHYFALFWIVTVPASLLVLAKSRRELVGIAKVGVTLLGLSVVLIAGWLGLFVQKAKTTMCVADFWIPRPSPRSLLISFKNFCVGFQSPKAQGVVAAVLFGAVLLFGVWRGLRESRAGGIALLIANAAVPVCASFVVSRIAKNSIYLDRCLIASGVFVLILVAHGLSSLGWKARTGALAAMVLFCSVSLSNHYHNVIPDISHCPGVRPRKEFRAACDYVRQSLREGDLIAHTCRSSLGPFLVYIPPQWRQIVLATSTEHKTQVMRKYPYRGMWASKLAKSSLPILVWEIPRGYRRLILIASEWDIGKMDFYHSEKIAITRWLDEHYARLRARRFYGVEVYFYDLTRPRLPATSVGGTTKG